MTELAPSNPRAPARAFARLAPLWPWTATGTALLLVAGLLLGVGGRAWQDHVLLVTGGVLLAAVALSTTIVVAAWWTLRRRLRDAPAVPRALNEGRESPTGVDLTLPWWLPGARSSGVWLHPDAELVAAELESVRPRRRAAAEGVRRQLQVEDALGLARLRIEHAQTAPCRVEPDPGPLDHVALTPGWWRGSDRYDPLGRPAGDPYDLRPYVPGDPLRFVLWKVYARTQRLVVRTPERAVSPVHEVVAWLVCGDDDDAAAGVAWMAVRRGHLGQAWQLGADGVADRARDVPAALDVLQRSAEVAAPRCGLAAFLREAGAGRTAVVFTPGRPGPWLDDARAAIAAAPMPVEVVVACDGVADPPDARWWEPEPPTPAGVPRAEIDAVAAALTSAGARVAVIDRRTGEIHHHLPGGQRA